MPAGKPSTEQGVALPPRPLAVIDVGSNSGRVVVLQVGSEGHLELLADGRSPLRLARDVEKGSRLSEAAILRTVSALRDFGAIAAGAGASKILAVATSAVRASSNSDELLQRIRLQSGLKVRVIEGAEEARLSFIGSIAGLPVEHGWVADIGGGSLELTHFRDRKQERSLTLPVGALAMSDRFLLSDPPSQQDVRELSGAVRGLLAESDVGPMEQDEQLVGTGGTVRNVAKIDHRSRAYPIPRLHGFIVTRQRIEEIAAQLASKRASRRESVRGLNRDRADSIVGGVLVAKTVVESLAASSLIVSGEGLREGIAYDAFDIPIPSPQESRASSVRALVARFATWDRSRADRRQLLAGRLLEVLEPDAGPSFRERLDQAATILDVGRSIDYYERYQHAADIVVSSDLTGFTHRKLALLAAVLRQGGDESMSLRMYRPLLGPQDSPQVARAATVLQLADEIEHRLRPREAAGVRVRDERRSVIVTAPVFDGYRRDVLDSRIRRTFRKRLVFEPERP